MSEPTASEPLDLLRVWIMAQKDGASHDNVFGKTPLEMYDATLDAERAKAEGLERKLAGECETCEGSGIMEVVVEVKPPYGEEITDMVKCAECEGSGYGWMADHVRARKLAEAQRDRLGDVIETQIAHAKAHLSAWEKSDDTKWRSWRARARGFAERVLRGCEEATALREVQEGKNACDPRS